MACLLGCWTLRLSLASLPPFRITPPCTSSLMVARTALRQVNWPREKAPKLKPSALEGSWDP
jgi:hypothetical protein